MVVTNDKELRKRLKEKGITVIFMRQGKYLSIDAP
jgi:rRNA-processing protein FCF1